MDAGEGLRHVLPSRPWIQTELDWKDAKISFTLNGEDVPMASGTTANLIHGIPEQIAAISSFSTLLPGDVIMTGTPNASGHLDPGDEPIVHVAGIGSPPQRGRARLGDSTVCCRGARPRAAARPDWVGRRPSEIAGTVRGIARSLDRDVDDWLGESIPFEQQAQVGLIQGESVFSRIWVSALMHCFAPGTSRMGG